ncbi:MAG: tRNA pseudouridine(13) synthase TruD [Myxococcota bacterium]|nr:tRNA pseudouridine(13) synthase TruD [Myxococcota bacterium]
MIRVDSPDDFRVDEVPLYAPSGEGGHTFVHVEKRCRSTEEVARALARAAGVAPRDVGYAGRKDRFAVTTQWFSVPGLPPEQARRLELPGVRVLAADAHPHKLRTGQLRANRFAITLRDPGAPFAALGRNLARLVERGMPNRFGEQRFGREGDNAERGRGLLAGSLRVRDRREARFLVSAFQAEVFNAVLADRAPDFDRVQRGDVAVVHESGGLFLVEDPEREAPRAAAFEISPTGPVFGTRVRRPEGLPGERERAILAEHGIDESLRPPRGLRLRGGRRALRVQPQEARLAELREGVQLEFTLPPGSYATVLVEELLAGPL